MKLKIVGTLEPDGRLPLRVQLSGLILDDPDNRRATEPVRIVRPQTKDEAVDDFISRLLPPDPNAIVWSREDEIQMWVFRDKVVRVEDWESASRDEITTHIKHKVLSAENAFAKLKNQVALFEKFEKAAPLRRNPIPEDVRLFVWRRDQGKCVQCGTNQKLEFDHIIPLVQGGADTERNIQLLCEKCNRQKGTSI